MGLMSREPGKAREPKLVLTYEEVALLVVMSSKYPITDTTTDLAKSLIFKCKAAVEASKDSIDGVDFQIIP